MAKPTAAEAARELFSVANPYDALRKYLGRWKLTFEGIRDKAPGKRVAGGR